MKLREPYGLFAVLRQSAFAKAGYTVQNPCGASRNPTALLYSTYLERCCGSIGTNGRTKAIGSSTEFGLKRPRAFLAIRTPIL